MRLLKNYSTAIFIFLVGSGLSFSAVAQPTPTLPAVEQSAPSPQSLSAILDVYFAWRGGTAFEHLQSIHQKGLADKTGQSTDEYWLDRSGRWRDEFDFGGVNKIRGATPDTSWTVNSSGQTKDYPSGTERIRRLALIEFGDALRGMGGAQVKLLGETRRSPIGATDKNDERLWAVLRVTFGDEDMYDLLIDPTTGMLGFYIFEESGQTFTYEFGDWRMVDGVRMPFRIVLNADIGYWDTHVTSQEINRPLDRSLFDRPQSAVRLVYEGPEKASGWINFTLINGQIRFPVMVNGHETTAWLDNGASNSVIDRQFADSVGLTTKGTPFSIHGVGPGLETGQWVPGATITIGSLTLQDLTLGTMDAAAAASTTRIAGSIPLFLGDEAFAELIVDIDFPHRRIKFQDLARFSAPKDAIEIPLSRHGEESSVPISIEGRSPIQAVLDLGDSGTLDVFPDYAQSEHLLDGRRVSQSLFGGAGGIQSETDVVLRTLRFGAANLADVPVSILPQRVRGTYSDKVQGAIGTRILSRYRMIFDYPHSRVYAIPDPKAISLPFEKNRLGVSWLPEGDTILVMLVVPNSPAAAAGLKVGDKIALINGQPAKGWSSGAARAALKEGPAGEKITFTLDSGDTRNVTLSDYY